MDSNQYGLNLGTPSCSAISDSVVISVSAIPRWMIRLSFPLPLMVRQSLDEVVCVHDYEQFNTNLILDGDYGHHNPSSILGYCKRIRSIHHNIRFRVPNCGPSP